MDSALATRIATEFAAAMPQLPAAVRSAAQRQAAIARLAERGLPDSRDENWKYVNLRLLEKVRFAPADGATTPALTLAELPPRIAGYARYTFVDGRFAPALSEPIRYAGVRVEPMDHRRAEASAQAQPTAAAEDSLEGGATAGAAADLRFALLNDAFATDGARIHVAAQTQCATCIELVFVASSAGKTAASYPRVDFSVGAGARVGLIERHVSASSDANFIISAVQVQLERDAHVQHYRVQQTGARAICFDTLNLTLAQNACYRLYGLNLGALSARSTVHAQLMGRGSEVGIFNVSVANRSQVHDTYALVEHVAPGARTEQVFRGICGGRGRVAFNGKIVVHQGAHGTDSSQVMRGLLAGAEAEIDLRPQLEIYTDDVRCSHGATTGKLDEDMLFYMLSRGLDRETAMRLLKWAFLQDVVARIEVPELRRQIEQSLARELNEAAALKELL